MKIKCLVIIFLVNLLCITGIFAGEVQDKINVQAQNYYFYLKAEVLRNSGQHRKSAQVYQNIFSLDPSIYVNEGFIKLLYDIGQFGRIANISENIKDVFLDNLQLQLIFAQSYLYTDKDEKAEEIFEVLAQQYPDNEHVAYHSAILLLKSGRLKEAIEFLDKCLQNPNLSTRHFLFYFLKSKIYLQQKQFNLALQCIEKSLSMYPKFERGWLFKALLSEQMGRINDAISGYKQYLDIVRHDTAVEKQLVHLLFMQKRFSEASKVMQKMGEQSAAYYFDLALIEWKKENYKQALVFINKSLQLNSAFKKAKFLKIEILFTLHQHNKIVDFVASWIFEQPDDPAIVHTYMLLKRLNIAVPLLIKKLETLIEKENKNIKVLSALADLALEEKLYDKAEHYYKQILKLTINEKLKSKLLFQLGYIYFVQNKTDKIEQTLKKSIELKYVHPSAYNLLAYYYAQKEQNLDYALQLIEKGLKMVPNCPYYLDTQGFILLKKGYVGKAVAVLEKALRLLPSDLVIQQRLKTARSRVK